jgi:hypothetical protein
LTTSTLASSPLLQHKGSPLPLIIGVTVGGVVVLLLVGLVVSRSVGKSVASRYDALSVQADPIQMMDAAFEGDC